jgi:hypothetical protein
MGATANVRALSNDVSVSARMFAESPPLQPNLSRHHSRMQKVLLPHIAQGKAKEELVDGFVLELARYDACRKVPRAFTSRWAITSRRIFTRTSLTQ